MTGRPDSTALVALAKGLTHEINNPLAVLLANLHYVLQELRPRHEGVAAEVLEALTEAEFAAQRVSRIVKELAGFAREPGEDQGPGEVAAAVGAAVELVRQEVEAKARLVVDCPPGPLLVRGGSETLSQVFARLLLQAAAALPDGHAGEHEVSVTVRRDYLGVEVAVSDTGPRIPPEVLPHVFKPFYRPFPGFTVDMTGRGIGLGLAACHGMVQAAGGALTVESPPGRETTFLVQLRAASSETRLTLHSADAPRRSRPRVLVLDEDPLVCAMRYRDLSRRFDVVPHVDARSALSLLHAGEVFDAVVCGRTPAALTARELEEAITAIVPSLAGAVLFLPAPGDPGAPPAGGADLPRSGAAQAADVVQALLEARSREG